MTHEELYDAARRQPFSPFRLVLTTGETFDIRHPDLIMVGRRSAVVGVTNNPAHPVYDRSIRVDLLHVVAIEELPVAPPPARRIEGPGVRGCSVQDRPAGASPSLTARRARSSGRRLQLQLGRPQSPELARRAVSSRVRPSLAQVGRASPRGLAADRAGHAPRDVERAERQGIEAGRLVGGEELQRSIELETPGGSSAVACQTAQPLVAVHGQLGVGRRGVAVGPDPL